MDEPDQVKEDFGTKICNRCNLVFKRANRYNFFCPKCARLNDNTRQYGVTQSPDGAQARAGHNPFTP